MKRIVLTILALSPVNLALAQDEQPAVPPPFTAGLARPPVTPPASTLDDVRLAELVDRAVDRAVARRLAAQAGPPAGVAYPSAQSVSIPPPRVRTELVPAAPRRTVGSAPVIAEERQYVRVELPRGACKRCLSAVGERLVEAGRPRTKLMRVAPSELVTCTSAAPARAVHASQQSE